MNVCLFFEGTGQGVAGRITNVTRLRDLCVEDAWQKLHLEAGPGTHFGSYLAGKIAGVDWQTTFRSARRWFEANYEKFPKGAVVLHDSHSLASNLWGAFDRVKRDLPRLRLHFRCKGL